MDRKKLAPREFCRFHNDVISWRKAPFVFVIAWVFPVLALRAQTDAPAVPDPLGVRAAMAAAEKEHREFYQAAKYDEAIRAARRGLELAERSGTLNDQVPFIRHLAYDYWLRGDNDSSIDYSQRLLDSADLLDDNRSRAQGHRYLSQVYETLNDDLRARSHAENSMKFATASGEEQLRISALNAIALSELRARHFDDALRMFQECRAFWQKQGSRLNANNMLANVADVADARGDLAGALKTYEEILAVRVELNDRRGQVRAVSAIAGLLRRLGRPDDALARLTATRPLAESVGGHRLLAEFYGHLAQVHEARREFQLALATERLAATERDQLISERARLRAAELESRLGLLQKQQAIDQLRSQVAINEARLRATASDLAHVRSFRIAVIDGVIAFAVIVAAGFTVWRYRVRTRRLHAAVTQAAQPTAASPQPPSSDS